MTTRKLSVSEGANKRQKSETTSATQAALEPQNTHHEPVSGPNSEPLSGVEATRALIRSKSKVWKPLVWIDCEMTGLNVYEDHIIEICCIITDGHMNVIDPNGYESTIFYPKSVMDAMNPWCIDQHGRSGLTAKVLANPERTLAKVQQELLEYIQRYVEPHKGIMAGNSIHMDKFFMNREFPKVIEHLHYRLVDVSTVMEIGHRHNPDLMKVFPKKDGAHTAKSDILESIDQLKWYKKHYLKSKEEVRDFVEEERKKMEEKEGEAKSDCGKADGQ